MARGGDCKQTEYKQFGQQSLFSIGLFKKEPLERSPLVLPSKSYSLHNPHSSDIYFYYSFNNLYKTTGKAILSDETERDPSIKALSSAVSTERKLPNEAFLLALLARL